MAKKDTAAEIKAANGVELNPDDYTQAELDTLLALAKDPAKRAEFDAQAKALKGTPQASSTVAEEDAGPTLTVKVNPDKGSGSYLHPVSKQAVVRGGEAVKLPDDAWTQDMVAKRFLLEVRK
ncbi:hypothetical protein [Deinococcus geothermalis]|uniref:hypothetical protein n=1 Tax=Deinococcus geothermalis TaxID=68909 RepID=UPI002356DE26|nr:hypothetical protein [Deinococcus geothermalis]